ncbi:MAG: hypothetical protein K6B65_00460 [Bacilli bacterium]|nr:hypothetical protein [Bacilli bacterium]
MNLGTITIVMETRINRYARYREQIRRLPEGAFKDDGKFATKVTSSDLQSLAHMGSSSGAITYSSAMGRVNSELNPVDKKDSPYSLYLHKKRIVWLIKIIAALALVGALIAMYFLFVVQ